MNIKKITLGLIALAIFSFTYYAVSPLFRNVVIDDELPENSTVENGGNNESTASNGTEKLTPKEMTELEKAMDEAKKDGINLMNDVMPVNNTGETFVVMHTLGHPAEGKVRVLPTSEDTIVRFENYKTINGPQLHVYLSKDLEANDFIDLGKIRGTEGNINYSVPEGTDISEYKYVMVWCVPFGVLFNYAEIN